MYVGGKEKQQADSYGNINRKFEILECKKIAVLIFLEKVLFLNFRYLFRYLLLGFPSAFGSFQKQKSEKKWVQTLSKAPKNPKTKIHVVRAKSTNNAVENSIK